MNDEGTSDKGSASHHSAFYREMSKVDNWRGRVAMTAIASIIRRAALAATKAITTGTAATISIKAAIIEPNAFRKPVTADLPPFQIRIENSRLFALESRYFDKYDLPTTLIKRHKKSSSSSDDRRFSSPLAHSQHSDTLLTIVSGDLCENWFLKLRDIKEVIRRAKSGSQRSNDWRESKDKFGNTALLVSGRRLLEEKQFDKAVELAKILLDEGADVNVINDEKRTLLSYSISCMDESIRLTTLLLNYGADVWSMGAVGELAAHPIDKTETNRGGRTATSCNNSAFAWFLRGVMRQLQFGDHCLRTFYVLAETMGENPAEMQRHAIATMLNHSKCYTIFGPLFYQIKQAMHPYWSQPRSLKYLSRSVIRKRISGAAGRFVNEENVSSLKLPPPLRAYLMLES